MTTITIDNQNEIKEILSLMTAKPNSLPLVKPKAIKVSPNDELREIANFLYESANTLPQDWKSMSSENKQVLIDLAYKWADDEERGTTALDALLFPFRLVVFLFRYRYEAVQAFKDARDIFIDAIFNEIENSNPCYQEMLDEVLNEAITEITARENGEIVGQEIKAEDTREWLRNLSNRAIAKV